MVSPKKAREESPPQYHLGVDTGGTFTDFALFDSETQRVILYKLPSTPEEPSVALIDGLKELLDGEGINPRQLMALSHGTTVAINAVLQDRLPEIGMITTEGFRDILELARQRRPHLYNLDIEKPKPLAPRRLRLEVQERVDALRRVQVPLDEAGLASAVSKLKNAAVPSVAICFLHSYGNSSNERRARAVLRRLFPGVLISISSEVLREFREFERFSTTALNAALLPVMHGYLDRLGRQVRRFGVSAPPRISSSYGGTVALRTAKERPITTLVSGPSAGVVGAAAVAASAGFSDLITLDIGGTSTDVCLVFQGAPLISRERLIGGRPVLEATLDVHSIGAGGGSILWVDQGGFLQVGPQSAGARPGPVCYDRGGTKATLTDANVVAQRLNPARELGGHVKVDLALAERALHAQIAEPLGFSTDGALYGAFEVLTSNLTRAVRVVSVERGYDPRAFALVAYGGAGPMHACQLAKDMSIGTVLVPESPGILSALGLLMADVRAEFSQSRLFSLYDQAGNNMNAVARKVEDVFVGLERRSSRWLRSEGIDKVTASAARIIEVRYQGQGHQVSIAVDGVLSGTEGMERLIEEFHRSYQEEYGYARRGTPVELVHFRVQVRAPGPRPQLRTSAPGDGRHGRALLGSRRVYLDEDHGFSTCPIYWRPLLKPEDRFEGPAIIEQLDSTTVLLPGQRVYVDQHHNLVISVERGAG